MFNGFMNIDCSFAIVISIIMIISDRNWHIQMIIFAIADAEREDFVTFGFVRRAF